MGSSKKAPKLIGVYEAMDLLGDILLFQRCPIQSSENEVEYLHTVAESALLALGGEEAVRNALNRLKECELCGGEARACDIRLCECSAMVCPECFPPTSERCRDCES